MAARMAEGRKGWLLESRMQRWKAARLKRQPQIQEEGEGSATGGRDVGWGGEGLQWRETTGEHIIREGARGVRRARTQTTAPPPRAWCVRAAARATSAGQRARGRPVHVYMSGGRAAAAAPRPRGEPWPLFALGGERERAHAAPRAHNNTRAGVCVCGGTRSRGWWWCVASRTAKNTVEVAR